MDLTYWLTSLLSWMFGSITGLLVTVLVLLLVRMYVIKPSNQPPGPWGVPVLGIIPFMGRHPAKSFTEMSKKYGPVMSVYFGSMYAVVLSDYQVIKKALIEQADTFSGRYQGIGMIEPREAKSVIATDGQFWVEHRRFALTTLRDFGIGKASLEPSVLDEINHFLDEIEKKKGEPFDVADMLGISICNNICMLNFGRRFEYNDSKLIQLKHGIEAELSAEGRKADPLFFIPALKKIPGIERILRLDIKLASLKRSYEFMEDEVKNHRKDYHEGKKDDYIDAYFTERNERQRTNNQPDIFDDDALYSNLRLLFIAGMDTTTNTLNFGLIYMILHQDVQRKVQQEIDDVIGRQRSPSMEDRLRMPYTEATLLELQRIRTVVPLSIIHRVLKDTELNGYHIPKDTLIMPNLWSVHNDPKLFPDPESFRPERFINEDGKVLRPEYLIPFSIGKRQCLGESLARMELFLYFTSMFQRFTFTKPEGAIITTDIVSGLTDCAKPYILIATSRS